MNKPLKVLLIEDSELDAELLVAHLQAGGYEPVFERVDNARDLTEAMRRQRWELVLSDHNMPGFDSTDALRIVRGVSPDVPFLIVSGSIGEDLAVASMRAGAQDYIMKGNLARLVAAVDRELKEAEVRRARRIAEHALMAHEEELRIARTVQQQLFPAASPTHAGYDMAGASCPAEATGGDYFDFIAGPSGEIFVVVGDVTGHGLGPALLMTDVRAYLRALVLSGRSLEEIVGQARHLLIDDLGSDRFITLLFAQLTRHSGHLDTINAGHPSGYVMGEDGRIRAELPAKAPALGIAAEQERLVPERVALQKGDVVLFVTDGVLEAASPEGEEFGEARMLEVLRQKREQPSAEIIRELFGAVRRFAGQATLPDDMTAVVVKCLKKAEAAS